MASLDEIIGRRDQWLSVRGDDTAAHLFVAQALPNCRLALMVLGRRLQGMDYPVANIITLPGSDLAALIAQVEATTQQPIPPVLKSFWHSIGGASLMQSNGTHREFWSRRNVRGAHQYSDALHIDHCNSEWANYMRVYEDLAADGEPETFQYVIAPDGFHKDGICGGGPYTLSNDDPWFPAVEGFEWSGCHRPQTATDDPTDFLSYLRTTILECGGFSGFLGRSKFEPIRQKLIRDLPVF